MNNIAQDKTFIPRNQMSLAYIELGDDLVFKSLTKDQQQQLIQQAAKIGQETAAWIADLYHTRDPRSIAQQMGIKVQGEQSLTRSRFVKSLCRIKEKEIIIYRDVIDKLLHVINLPGFSENILKILVALELFKYLEHTKVGIVYKRFELPGKKLGPFEFKRSIPGLSAVAAYAFACDLLELLLTPANFDYLVYILFTKQ